MPRLLTLLAVAALPVSAVAQQSAPVTNLRYQLTYTSATAAARSLTVTTRFQVAGVAPVLLSLPSWTPGAYEVSNFARRVSSFAVTQGGKPLTWDKTDPDTWRIRPTGKGEVTITFDFLANQLDNAMAWSAPEFLLVNGTNVFLYPEGRSLDFPARVSVTTESDWRVATGMTPDAGAARLEGRQLPRPGGHAVLHRQVRLRQHAGGGQVDPRWRATRAGTLAGAQRAEFWSQLSKYLPIEIAVFQAARRTPRTPTC